MPERIVHAGETVVWSLSAASSILLVEASPGIVDCRGCLLLALDCTRSERFAGAASLLAHLDAHAKAGHAGAADAIWKVEACGKCRGAGFFMPGRVNCAECAGTGKNAAGRDRGVRRGVVVVG